MKAIRVLLGWLFLFDANISNYGSYPVMVNTFVKLNNFLF